MMDKALMNPDVIKEIDAILKRGNTVELKKEKEYLVIVEIQRKAKNKTSIIG
jgi:hypothetical protein